ncbi:MAG: OsmC family protein [Abditibacteriaceae bacterium]
MSETHHFELQSQLTDQVEGDGNLTLSTGTINYGVPSQFGGTTGKTSPEELILAALSSCFSMTLGFVLEKRKVSARLLGMHAEGIVNRIERQLVLTAITIHPQIAIDSDSEKTRQDVNAAIERSEQACLISNAIRGNVELKVEAVIEIHPR